MFSAKSAKFKLKLAGSSREASRENLILPHDGRSFVSSRSRNDRSLGLFLYYQPLYFSHWQSQLLRVSILWSRGIRSSPREFSIVEIEPWRPSAGQSFIASSSNRFPRNSKGFVSNATLPSSFAVYNFFPFSSFHFLVFSFSFFLFFLFLLQRTMRCDRT